MREGQKEGEGERDKGSKRGREGQKGREGVRTVSERCMAGQAQAREEPLCKFQALLGTEGADRLPRAQIVTLGGSPPPAWPACTRHGRQPELSLCLGVDFQIGPLILSFLSFKCIKVSPLVVLG